MHLGNSYRNNPLIQQSNNPWDDSETFIIGNEQNKETMDEQHD